MQGPDLRTGVSTPVVGPDTYTDYKTLPSRAAGDSPEALKKAAREFESVFLNLWLKSMRDANSAFGEGSYLDSPAMDTHQQMLDGEIALSMANSGGIGLADVIERQLSGQSAPVRRDVDVRDPADLRRRSPAPDSSDSGRTVVTPLEGTAETPEASDRRGFLLQLSSALDQVLEGTTLPKLGILAQAALETGWGRHVIQDRKGGSSNNLFGIKATGWTGDSVATKTREFLGGRFLDKIEAFRVYDSLQSGVSDYIALLQGSARYNRLFDAGADRAGDALDEVRRFAQTLQRGGYATDPRYAEKIVDVARSIMQLTGGL